MRGHLTASAERQEECGGVKTSASLCAIPEERRQLKLKRDGSHWVPMDTARQGTELGEAARQSLMVTQATRGWSQKGLQGWLTGGEAPETPALSHSDTGNQEAEAVRSWWEGTTLTGSRAPGGMSGGPASGPHHVVPSPRSGQQRRA